MARANWWSEPGVASASRPAHPTLPVQRQGVAGGHRAVVPDRAGGLAEHRLHGGVVGLDGHAPQRQLHVVRGGQLGVAAHVPGRGPADRPRQRALQLGHAVEHGGQRALVKANLGVAQVVVVEQDQVRLPQPDELGHLGARPAEIGLDAPDAAQHRAAGLLETRVQPDRDPVLTQRRVPAAADCRTATLSNVPSSLSPSLHSGCSRQWSPATAPTRWTGRSGGALERPQQVAEFGVAVACWAK